MITVRLRVFVVCALVSGLLTSAATDPALATGCTAADDPDTFNLPTGAQDPFPQDVVRASKTTCM